MLPITLVSFAGVVAVADVDSFRSAVANAKAGDEIVLESGTYRTGDLSCAAAGSDAQPIVVRAKSPRGARVELTGDDGFVVSGTRWTFADLEIQGVCSGAATCAHAFRVVGAANGFVARGNRIVDFDAQIAVELGDAGLVEGNEIFDTHPRATANAVRKIDLAAGDDWILRANVIRDFRRSDDVLSHGIFVHGGGEGVVIERNLVACTRDEARSGAQVGIALAGHEGAILRNDIVANCAGVAVDVRDAPGTRLLFGSLVGTAGVSAGGATTTLDAHANLLEGAIVTSDGAAPASETDDVALGATALATMYVAPSLGDLRKKGDLSAVVAKTQDGAGATDDFCGRARGAAPFDVGAIAHSLGDCLSVADAGAPDAAPGITPAPPSASSSGGVSSGGGASASRSSRAPADGGCHVTPSRRGDMAFAAFAALAWSIASRVVRRRGPR